MLSRQPIVLSFDDSEPQFSVEINWFGDTTIYCILEPLFIHPEELEV